MTEEKTKQVQHKPDAVPRPAPVPVPASHSEPAPAARLGRAHGVIALRPESCTSCMICVRECPDWSITLDFHQETTTPQGRAPGRAGRTRTVNVLDRFVIDYSTCMFCGVCVDVCPHEALFWSPERASAAPSRDGLSCDQDALAVWLRSVPQEQLTGGDQR